MEGNTSSHQVIGICYAQQQQQTQLLSVKDLNYLKPDCKVRDHRGGHAGEFSCYVDAVYLSSGEKNRE